MGSIAQNRMNFSHVSRGYPIPSGSREVNVWDRDNLRIQKYLLYWRFYKGEHWTHTPEPGEPQTTANFVQKFLDKHTQYLFGNGFSIHCNFRGRTFVQAEDLLNENWEKNAPNLQFQMGQVGGVTGDCWVNVGLDTDPIFGDRVKYTVIPSETVYPIFANSSDTTPTAILLHWHEQEAVTNAYGRVTYRAVQKGEYWTRDKCVFLRDNKPYEERVNILGEIPFVHMPNLLSGTEFWGRSDMESSLDLNREFNEKITDIGDIINYHAAPVTVIYGAKASSLQKGARRVWSGLPKDARIENLQLYGDLGAANMHLEKLRQLLFELSSMTGAAFGGAEFISNTSGVALAIQFAPIVEHMKLKRKNYGYGIQRLNYLTLRLFEILGVWRANGQPMPYYSHVKWPDPLPRDKSLELQNLMVMKQMTVLSRVQILRQLITNDIAPEHLDESDADALIQEAVEEEMKFTQLLAAAGQPPVQEGEDFPDTANADATAQRASESAQRDDEANAAVA